MTSYERFAMPGSARSPEVLVDTSVAVALTVADHEHHDATIRMLGSRNLRSKLARLGAKI
jgi:hypothetical protein